MTANTLLRVDRLRLRNFRCFAECAIELHPQLTVLVAENGRGKTAVLDALGIALGPFVDTVAGTAYFRGFDRTDVRLVRGQDDAMEPALPTEFVADGYVAGRAIHWGRALRNYALRARTTKKEAESLRLAAHQLRANTQGQTPEENAILPLVAFYGTGRLWSEHRLTEGKRKYVLASDGRMSGYTDCLSSSSSFKGMVAWYENKMNETRDPRFKAELPRNLPLLTAVQEATRVVLAPTGWCELDWDFEKKSLVVGHPDYGRLPLSALSDGVRNMIALIADIARRCASLNPHLSDAAARLTPGVLLIDEVDMHLHPRWQQLVIGLLQAAFPAMQMVLSTHSPHVLSTVDAGSIRVIRLSDGYGVPEIPTFQTRGVESADILAKVMDVDPVPQVEQARWLSDYRALVQTGDHGTVAAQSLWDKLVTHFGKEHPVLAEVETLRRLQEFKRANNLPLQRGS
ncbi:Predicted ATP-binding protein involved in virulence [Rhizobiales bacterium GAS113]|nr:Predicted ATP-binding protein involved in virulence [Rhizobiales bacterium GAS113]